jgi:peptidoglycan hydrolase-like protein with peptidoglycan-binding domain
VSTARDLSSHETGGPLTVRRRPWMLAAAVLALLAAAIALPAWFTGARQSDGTGARPIPTSLATITQRSLSSQIRVGGTLGYSGNYAVVNQSRGTITALPPVGAIISRGESLYEVDGSPVILLYGQTPAYRTLSEGMSGSDVAQLNANLVELGLAGADLAGSDRFGPETAAAVRKLQAALGLSETGSLTFGQVAFLPTAARVTTVAATLGAPAQPGAVVLRGTSTTPQVIAALEAVRQSQVRVGDHVAVVLPDGRSTPGIVSAVGTVATVPTSGGSGGASGRPTLPVEITLTDPAAVGSADQAPVHIVITTATVADALVVPVTALLALSGGGFAVEVVDGTGARHVVPVSLGLFDESFGVIQVIGPGIAAGQQVVVPGQ